MIPATIVLEGGASRGVFTAGALDFLMEKEQYFSNIIGVSAGACNALDYVSQQIGRTKQCMIHENKEYSYFDFKKMLKTKSLLDMDLMFDKFPNAIYPFDYDTFFQSEAECEIVVTNCNTGKAEYLTVDSDKELLFKATRASCSLPLLAPIVNINNTPYLDGGLADSIPIRRALQKKNEKIIVILTRNEEYKKAPPTRGAIALLSKAYKNHPELILTIRRRHYVYNKTLAYLNHLEREGRIFVLRPLVKPVSRLEDSADALHAFLVHGYTLMSHRFDELQSYLDN